MKFDQNKSLVNEKLASSSKKKVEIGTQPEGSLRGSLKQRNERQTLRVLAKKSDTFHSSKDSSMPTQEEDRFERTLENESRSNLTTGETGTGNQNRRERLSDKDERRLVSEHWSRKRGHELTYLGIFLFTLTLYFRPYELIPGLASFQSLALILAVVTLLIYLPSQLSLEGKLTAFPVEIKCALFLIFWALLTLPLAKDTGLAWAQLKDFGKVIIVFVVMVNVLRNRTRLKGLMWLAISSGVMVSFQALSLYRKGQFTVEGYRVGIDFGGMFGNPNDMALHLAIFLPIAAALGIGAGNRISKLAYFASVAIMAGGVLVTQSRGGFLGFAAGAAVLIWKFGRKSRLKTVFISAVASIAVLLYAPGNFGLRLLSIFVPSLDPVGSASARTDLLMQSVWVTLRNPIGIGIGNFPVVGAHNHVTHNAYTQVSSELGWLAFGVYLILLAAAWRTSAAVERQSFPKKDLWWVYCISVGIQASLAAYMVSSFFGSVAYNWYAYYPIAYAVCLRRIYQIESLDNSVPVKKSAGSSQTESN